MSTRIIKLNRGDSFEFVITIPDKEDPTKNYILSPADALYFALLYPHQRIDEPCVPICKGYLNEDQTENGEIVVKITHNDTKNLTPGIYYYTAKLHTGGSLMDMGASVEPDEVRTIIERTKFIINE